MKELGMVPQELTEVKISIRSFAPTIPINAVYFDDDINKLFRNPIVLIKETVWGEYDEEDRLIPTWSEIALVSAARDGYFGSDCTENQNFIGYEYNNVEQNWEEETKEYLSKGW